MPTFPAIITSSLYMFPHLNQDFRTKFQMEFLFLITVLCAHPGLQEVGVWCVKLV